MGKFISLIEKDPKPIPQELPEGTSLAIVKTKEGGIREMLRSEKGTFVKKPKPLIPTLEFTRAERKKLNAVRSDKGGLTEYLVAFMNIVRIAQCEDTDPKAMMAAVKAFEVIRQSALGKYATAEQDLDRITTQPVKVVVIQAPQLMHPDVIEEKPKEILVPAWVETNPKA